MEKEILTMEEAAELFGVSVKTFIKLLKEEKVPARKIGREWRFSKSALIHWLAAGDSQIYSSSEADSKEFFDAIAPQWEEVRKNYFDASVKNKILDLDILGKKMTVVDLGAGDGFISRGIAQNVKKVIAVDNSERMLDELKKKSHEEQIRNIETVQSKAQDMPLDDGSVDIVCTNMLLHHIENPKLVIKEMARVLKKGGLAVVSDFVEHTDVELKEKMHDYWQGFDPEELKVWFEENGFHSLKMEILKNRSRTRRKTDIFILLAEKQGGK